MLLDFTMLSFHWHFASSRAPLAPGSRLPFALDLFGFDTTNCFLFFITAQTAYSAQQTPIVLKNKGRAGTYSPVCMLHSNPAATNNGRADPGKTKGLDSSSAASRVLPNDNRRKGHDAVIIFLELAPKTRREVTKELRKGGGSC